MLLFYFIFDTRKNVKGSMGHCLGKGQWKVDSVAAGGQQEGPGPQCERDPAYFREYYSRSGL